ncbi:MAG: Xaa-Pro dipeptidase [Gammaproteobacteria bacterium]|nr:MAG: Xaa-Pro dipeptidase [Gammaproteobacteria bacterium]
MTVTTTNYSEHLTSKLSFYGQLMEEFGYTSLIISSGLPKQIFWDDNPYPFKVNIHFKALVPVSDVANSYIIFKPGNKPTLAFYQPEDYWHVVPADPKGVWVECFDIKTFRGRNDWQQFLPKNRKGLVWIGEPQEELGSLNITSINPENLINPIHYQRAYKSDYEVACLRQANLIAAKGHLAAKEAFYDGCSELEIHGAYLQASNQKEEELPYSNIIALNEHGAVLHYTDLTRQRYAEQNIHSFLIDAGASYLGYCSDITRTWSYKEAEFADLIKAFDSLQQDLIKSLVANKSYVDMHINTHLKIAELLKESEFIYCDADTALETGITSTFYPHGLGHLLGLQVHDIGGQVITPQGEINPPPTAHPFLRLTKQLEVGFCITLEPGLYFIDLLLNKLKRTKNAEFINWTKVENFKKFGGIRIEDDLIIKQDGVENLTRDAFNLCLK